MQNNTVVVGADANGYKKIFYYSNKEKWVVSNSFDLISSKLKSWEIKLSANVSQYLSVLAGSNYTQQMTSYDTILNEIKVLPSFYYIEILGNEFKFKLWEMPKFSSYEEALSSYINIWLSRIKTLLMSDQSYVVPDLTGGRDSRAVFALFYAVFKKIDGEQIKSHFTFNSSKGIELDFNCAKNICDNFKLPLNKPLPKYFPQRLSSIQKYGLWKELNLGVYYSFYYPNTFPTSNFFRMSGAAGGNHSPFYPRISTELFLDRYKKHFMNGSIINVENKVELFETWKHQVQSSVDLLVQNTSFGNVHPHILMYREFRDRFHGGRSPQYGLTIVPLASKYLTAASNLCSAENLENYQIHVDLIENLCPGLINMTYESESKAPSEFSLNHITKTKLPQNISCGEVFSGEKIYSIDGDVNNKSPFDHFCDDFFSYADLYGGDGYLSKDYVNKQISELNHIKLSKGFSHASKIYTYSHILAHKYFDL